MDRLLSILHWLMDYVVFPMILVTAIFLGGWASARGDNPNTTHLTCHQTGDVWTCAED